MPNARTRAARRAAAREAASAKGQGAGEPGGASKPDGKRNWRCSCGCPDNWAWREQCYLCGQNAPFDVVDAYRALRAQRPGAAKGGLKGLGTAQDKAPVQQATAKRATQAAAPATKAFAPERTFYADKVRLGGAQGQSEKPAEPTDGQPKIVNNLYVFVDSSPKLLIILMSFSGFEPRREKSGYATPAAMTSQLLITHPCEGPTPKRCELTSGQQEKQCRRPSGGRGTSTAEASSRPKGPKGPMRPPKTTGGPRRPQEASGKAQEAPKSLKKPQKASQAPKGPRRPQEAPASPDTKRPRRPQKASGGPRRPGAFWGILKPFDASWGLLWPSEASWGLLEHPGASWGLLGSTPHQAPCNERQSGDSATR